MRKLFGLLLISSQLCAQHVYWVEFSGKDDAFFIASPQQFLSNKAILRRQKFGIQITESDLPISSSYLQQFEQNGIVLLSKSKWLNGVAVVVPTKNYFDTLKNFSFVKRVKYLGEHQPILVSTKQHIDGKEMLKVLGHKADWKKKQTDTSFYGKTYRQVSMLNTHLLHEQGYTGKGVNIAVIDAGFNNTDTLLVFDQLRNSHQLKLTNDFVQRNANVFEDDDHGTAVLSCMAGYIPFTFVGTAPMANYYLFRSEYTKTEMPIEETYWIEAIEFADSLGVDLVNSSLGYNEFDDVSQNYTYKNLDGKTALISKAATLAVQKGMVVVVSAGNEGDDDWKFISVPADATEVITVGGVDAGNHLASFSSIGPTKDKRIKPDVMAQGDNVWVASSRGVFYQGDGTSYASPLMAGAIACLMQACPTKNPQEIVQALHTSGNHYYKPDNSFGYGIPDMQLAYLLLLNDTTEKLLDIRYLGDKRLHLAYQATAAQKINIVIKNEQGIEVHSETMNVKGTIRVSLKKNKELKKGKYSLHIGNENKLLVQPFTIP
jgi:serine protease AprX